MSALSTGQGGGALPDVIIIGAPKCGTTSLHVYLDLHPAIAMTHEKELHFFSRDHVWNRGLEWYRAQFDPDAELRGEASVSYSSWPKWPGVPQRMAGIIPDVRLLYLVRDPIDRIISSWVHRYSEGMESRPIEQVLAELDDNPIIDRSRYYRQLEEYFPYFPRERIHVVCSERLRAERRTVLGEVFTFLGVDPAFDTPGFDRVEHQSRFKRKKGRVARVLKRWAESRPARVLRPAVRRRIGYLVYKPFTRRLDPPHLDDRTRARLQEYLAPDVERLREFTGQSFARWSL